MVHRQNKVIYYKYKRKACAIIVITKLSDNMAANLFSSVCLNYIINISKI